LYVLYIYDLFHILLSLCHTDGSHVECMYVCKSLKAADCSWILMGQQRVTVWGRFEYRTCRTDYWVPNLLENYCLLNLKENYWVLNLQDILLSTELTRELLSTELKREVLSTELAGHITEYWTYKRITDYWTYRPDYRILNFNAITSAELLGTEIMRELLSTELAGHITEYWTCRTYYWVLTLQDILLSTELKDNYWVLNLQDILLSTELTGYITEYWTYATHPLLVPRLRMIRAIPLLPLWALRGLL
jgi:hypothetical protein